jgi:hypothetical protein
MTIDEWSERGIERRLALQAFAAEWRRGLQRQRTARTGDAIALEVGGTRRAQVTRRPAVAAAQQAVWRQHDPLQPTPQAVN